MDSAHTEMTNGQILQGSNREKYVVLDGKKLPISDTATENKLYGGDVLALDGDNTILDSLKTGAALTTAVHLIHLISGAREYWLLVEAAHYLTIIRDDQLADWHFGATFTESAELREISARELDMYIHTF
ncbi:hypothetical protein EQG49_01250 [Periweissella cryptocerci]|uniref:Uncharacterized protein n=1 Tax=Periweissella cryptocerci TaxID=2506420 RepID=A0A4P6YRD5_9LACO|nr:hypothetical protein [Periweissella cryptocerci]QBO35176.1 hypothetical protein EQG49_01250 [Periweissella cryptocerci]